MKLKGSKYLKVTGFLEIIIGIASLAMIFWILKENPSDYNVFGENVKDTLWLLVAIYAMAGFKILAGILGMILSNSKKSSMFCILLGVVLLAIGFTSIGQYELSITYVIFTTLALIIPACYTYGACLNWNEKKQGN